MAGWARCWWLASGKTGLRRLSGVNPEILRLFTLGFGGDARCIGIEPGALSRGPEIAMPADNEASHR